MTGTTWWLGEENYTQANFVFVLGVVALLSCGLGSAAKGTLKVEVGSPIALCWGAERPSTKLWYCFSFKSVYKGTAHHRWLLWCGDMQRVWYTCSQTWWLDMLTITLPLHVLQRPPLEIITWGSHPSSNRTPGARTLTLTATTINSYSSSAFVRAKKPLSCHVPFSSQKKQPISNYRSCCVSWILPKACPVPAPTSSTNSISSLKNCAEPLFFLRPRSFFAQPAIRTNFIAVAVNPPRREIAGTFVARDCCGRHGVRCPCLLGTGGSLGRVRTGCSSALPLRRWKTPLGLKIFQANESARGTRPSPVHVCVLLTPSPASAIRTWDNYESCSFCTLGGPKAISSYRGLCPQGGCRRDRSAHFKPNLKNIMMKGDAADTTPPPRQYRLERKTAKR